MHFRRLFSQPRIRYASRPLPVEPAYAVIAVLCLAAAFLAYGQVTPFHIAGLVLAALGNGILAFRPKL